MEARRGWCMVLASEHRCRRGGPEGDDAREQGLRGRDRGCHGVILRVRPGVSVGGRLPLPALSVTPRIPPRAGLTRAARLETAAWSGLEWWR
jgi:hypothetical protein